MIVYAAEGNGIICRIQVNGNLIKVFAAERQFMKKESSKEAARWQKALENLLVWGWIREEDSKGYKYKLTDIGYERATWLEGELELDTNNDPIYELKHGML